MIESNNFTGGSEESKNVIFLKKGLTEHRPFLNIRAQFLVVWNMHLKLLPLYKFRLKCVPRIFPLFLGKSKVELEWKSEHRKRRPGLRIRFGMLAASSVETFRWQTDLISNTRTKFKIRGIRNSTLFERRLLGYHTRSIPPLNRPTRLEMPQAVPSKFDFDRENYLKSPLRILDENFVALAKHAQILELTLVFLLRKCSTYARGAPFWHDFRSKFFRISSLATPSFSWAAYGCTRLGRREWPVMKTYLAYPQNLISPRYRRYMRKTLFCV